MKKRKAFTLAALFMAAASSLELSGYSWLDQSDGNNVLCDIDPSCRYLTNGEVDTLKTVFDDTLNYDSIKIFERSWFFGLDGLARNGLSRLGIDVESYRISNAIAPNGNIVSIYQVPLGSDGSYSTSIPAQGPLWNFDGDYAVSVSHGSDRNASVTFSFVHSEPEEVVEEVEEVEEESIEISEEELAEKCGEGTHLEDGVCILDESSESETVSANTGSVPTEGFNSWIYSITFTLLIAFVIAISLFLISRVRGKKTV